MPTLEQLDTPYERRRVIEYRVSEARVRKVIGSMPEFQ